MRSIEVVEEQVNGGDEYSGSKEFQANKKIHNEIEKSIDQAKTCEDLESALCTVLFSALCDTISYADNEKMTPEEEKQIEALDKQLDEKMSKKTEELGCEVEDELFEEDE